ncbi:polysaccharide biosynthesis/export family protein [candidate division KSB1 bacterium]|nr:polysaccharide biosynthesis/export family protein [candidate division KSB1 bacterium]
MPNIKVNSAIIVFVLAISNFFMACSSQLVRTTGLESNGYQVRRGDVLEIKFDYYPDYDQTVIVGPNGRTSFRAIEELQVIDLTISELRKNLIEKYSQTLAAPNLHLKVHSSSKFSIYVGGHIKKPGMVRFKKNLTIVEGVLLAGGLRDKSGGKFEIFVFRNRGDAGVKMYKFEIGKKVGGKVANRNFQLAPYDVVFIMKSKTAKKKNRTLI